MFADCGVIEFYIPPEDLARQDFSRVVALMNGG